MAELILLATLCLPPYQLPPIKQQQHPALFHEIELVQKQRKND